MEDTKDRKNEGEERGTVMLITNLDKNEIIGRCRQCQQEAGKKGLNGVMVWSRGGGTWDRYAGAGYFANHYQQRCYLPDQAPLWTGRSHCVVMIPRQGDPVLLVTTLEYRRDLVAIEDVRYAADFFDLVRDTAKELGMDTGNVGLMYGDVLTWKIGTEIKRRLPDMEWVPCDEILEEMRMVKTPMEIGAIRRACEIGSEALNIIMKGVESGKTEAQILGPAMDYIVSNGGVLYFVVTNSGENSTPVHSVDFPGYDAVRILNDGELFKVDLILVYQGYICDFGRTTVVGGKADAIQRQMIETAAGACEHIIANIRPGMTVRELCHMGDAYLVEHGVSLSGEQENPDQVYAAFPPHWGHGIGMTWERPWFIESEELKLKPGMYVAVEKALYKEGVGTVTYEQNLLITKEGAELLTTSKPVWLEET